MAYIHKTILRRKKVEYVLNKNTASSRKMQVLAYENNSPRIIAEIDTKTKKVKWCEENLDQIIKDEITQYS